MSSGQQGLGVEFVSTGFPQKGQLRLGIAKASRLGGPGPAYQRKCARAKASSIPRRKFPYPTFFAAVTSRTQNEIAAKTKLRPASPAYIAHDSAASARRVRGPCAR